MSVPVGSAAASHRLGPYLALDAVVEVDVADARAAAYLRRALSGLPPAPDGARAVAYRLISDDRGHVLERNGEPVLVEPDRPWLPAAYLLWHLNRDAVAATLPRATVLHAAAASWAGATVLLPAPMETGKSTLVTGLVRAGFAYVSDEAVAVDPATLTLTRYPKPIGLDPGSWPVLPAARPADADVLPEQWLVDAPGLPGSGGIAPDPVPPARLVVLASYAPGTQTRLEPMTPGSAVLQMARSCFGWPGTARRDLPVLARLAETVRAVRLHRGELDEAVAAVRAALEEEAA
ncbi:hypothetical protein [Motilibacter aurantiacus]|uniref:hypothetical protein n=1 Tax=Motilibacter aurantiacus TaxID=2714955 RepID=UPI0014092768|nr:hypothetical protein [Motilibacter aurantiacus]NHC45467.1 hypothetical protein [Motilibacter aurantiacus]